MFHPPSINIVLLFVQPEKIIHCQLIKMIKLWHHWWHKSFGLIIY